MFDFDDQSSKCRVVSEYFCGVEMKIVTWNINGVKARRPYLELFLDNHQPDVLCIQELKSMTDKVPTEIFTDRGYEVAVFGQKSWNGVMIASKLPMTDVVMGLPDNGHEDQSRAIAATIDGIRLINLYCPQGQAAESEAFQFKKRFYDRLQSWTVLGILLYARLF